MPVLTEPLGNLLFLRGVVLVNHLLHSTGSSNSFELARIAVARIKAASSTVRGVAAA